MDALTSGLNKTGEAVGSGVHGIASTIGKSVQGLGNAIDPSQGTRDGTGGGGKHADQESRSAIESNNIRNKTAGNGATGPTSGTATQADHAAATEQYRVGGGGLLGSITSGLTFGATSMLAPTVDALKSGTALSRDATREGFSIGQKIAKSGLDTGSNLATGTVTLTGTAVGGVVAAAAETSGAVFEPVSSGLKAVEGLENLGQGFDAINGLSIGAIRQVGQLTTKALNMSGKTPTFFDPDADGIVTVPDTIRGLVLLGLSEKNAKYASYALHSVFSYATSEKWLPELNTSQPIHVGRMSRTSWGRSWGSFERIDWVDDVEIDKFFADKNEKTWSDYWKQARQGFGVLLLIFEWGTTWPFYIPPLPVQEIPFSDSIGMIVRKAILPTIRSNFKKAREADPDAKNKPTSEMPSDKVPTHPKDA